MAANNLFIVREIDTPHQGYRILESYPTTDGIRSRICDWYNTDLEATKAEVERRLNKIGGNTVGG